MVLAFQVRRLEALEHVTNAFTGNPNVEKTPFVLPDWPDMKTRPATSPTLSRSS